MSEQIEHGRVEDLPGGMLRCACGRVFGGLQGLGKHVHAEERISEARTAAALKAAQAKANAPQPLFSMEDLT